MSLCLRSSLYGLPQLLKLCAVHTASSLERIAPQDQGIFGGTHIVARSGTEWCKAQTVIQLLCTNVGDTYFQGRFRAGSEARALWLHRACIAQYRDAATPDARRR